MFFRYTYRRLSACTKGDAQISLRDVFAREKVFFSATSKARQCVDQTFMVNIEHQRACLTNSKIREFRYSTTSRRWSTPRANYTWRIQQTDDEKYAVMCRDCLIQVSVKCWDVLPTRSFNVLIIW